MYKLAVILVSTTTLALVVLNGGPAVAGGGGSSGGWPAGYPLPTAPGTVISQSSSTAVVRSTDKVATVVSKLDILYVTTKGCTMRPAVNKPRDYLCYNTATKKTDEVYFTFAALDPGAFSPYLSQTNAFFVRG